MLSFLSLRSDNFIPGGLVTFGSFLLHYQPNPKPKMPISVQMKNSDFMKQIFPAWFLFIAIHNLILFITLVHLVALRIVCCLVLRWGEYIKCLSWETFGLERGCITPSSTGVANVVSVSMAPMKGLRRYLLKYPPWMRNCLLFLFQLAQPFLHWTIILFSPDAEIGHWHIHSEKRRGIKSFSFWASIVWLI